MNAQLAIIRLLGGGDPGAGEPSHPIVYPPPEPGVPSHPIEIPNPDPGQPTHPIVIPPPVDNGGEVTHPIAPGGERPTHPIAPGGSPGTPTHPIAPGGERPTPPIYVPIVPPGEPTHPIELPPNYPSQQPIPSFELRWSARLGFVLVPVKDATAQPKKR